LSLRRVLSYRLLWFEPSPPGTGDWPYQALAAATTHDLPTAAGLWTGRDLAARLALGLGANEEAELALRERIARWTELDAGAPPPQAVRRVYRLLGRAPCAIVTATLDDALVVEERPNMPGTTDEWPNWKLALPQPLEHLEQAPLAQEIASALGCRGQAGPDGG
jgi:4-alpha-glucanotransferase